MARGPVKFYDFVRMGAVGVTGIAPRTATLSNKTSMASASNDPQKWIEALSLLVNSGQKRQTLANNAKEYTYSLMY